MILNSEYLGTAKINPQVEVVAGTFGTWELSYTVGKYGIDDRGTIRIAWRSVSDWGTPQFNKPKESGYTTVTTSGKAKVRAEFSIYKRPFHNSIIIHVYDGYLYEGDKINIVFGDTSEGSIGMRTQSFRESEHEFKVLVDPYGTRRYEELPESLYLSVVGGKEHEIQAVIPSLINKGEEFDIVVRCIDEWGNPCNSFEGEVTMNIPEWNYSDYSILEKVVFNQDDKGTKRIKGNKVNKEGIFHLQVECRNKNLKSLSNGCKCSQENGYKLFWGDMHGQTKLTIGTGSLDEYYSFARDFAAVDFSGWQGNDFEIDDDKWSKVRQKTKEYNQPDEFITFLGYEWSGITSGGGDNNIFFLDDDEHFYPSSNWLSSNGPVNNEYNAYPLSKLFERFGKRKDVMAIPHIGGRHGNLDYYDRRFIKLIEVHSHHGTFDWFALEAMKRELKVGFVASSDDHTCRLGLSYPLSGNGNSASTSFDVKSGYVAVYANDLTRESIWEALNSRRCYASTFGRILLDVKIDGHYMGEEIDYDGIPEIKIDVLGSAPIDNIKIFNGTELISDKYLLNSNKINNNKKIRVVWSGVRVRTRSKSTNWDGLIYVEDGKIISAKEIAFDRLDQGISIKSDKFVKWTSTTSGDIDGIELEIDSNVNTKIHFNTNQKQFELDVKDISEKPICFDAGGENLQIEVLNANQSIENETEYLNLCKAQVQLSDNNIRNGFNAYWVKITQIDGNMAWSSPIFINKK